MKDAEEAEQDLMTAGKKTAADMLRTNAVAVRRALNIIPNLLGTSDDETDHLVGQQRRRWVDDQPDPPRRSVIFL